MSLEKRFVCFESGVNGRRFDNPARTSGPSSASLWMIQGAPLPACRAGRMNYGIHLDYIALREESLGSALSRVREVLEDDDRHLAAALAGQREDESLQMRVERVARPARRSGEAPGVAATARGTQGRKAAAEQGPPLEHANLIRPGRAGAEIAIAIVHQTTLCC